MSVSCPEKRDLVRAVRTGGHTSRYREDGTAMYAVTDVIGSLGEASKRHACVRMSH